jgi:hypothetical protein
VSRISELRESHFFGNTLSRDDVEYILEVLDVSLGYILVQSILPEDICEPCKYSAEGINVNNCPQSLDDCQEALYLFFDKAYDAWVEMSNQTPVEEEST